MSTPPVCLSLISPLSIQLSTTPNPSLLTDGKSLHTAVPLQPPPHSTTTTTTLPPARVNLHYIPRCQRLTEHLHHRKSIFNGIFFFFSLLQIKSSGLSPQNFNPTKIGCRWIEVSPLLPYMGVWKDTDLLSFSLFGGRGRRVGGGAWT